MHSCKICICRCESQKSFWNIVKNLSEVVALYVGYISSYLLSETSFLTFGIKLDHKIADWCEIDKKRHIFSTLIDKTWRERWQPWIPFEIRSNGIVIGLIDWLNVSYWAVNLSELLWPLFAKRMMCGRLWLSIFWP